MVDRFRILETHCCEGGATAGYMRVAEVWAVDKDRNRLRYNPSPFRYYGDALDIIRRHGHKFDLRHASPNCQWYTRGNAPRRGEEMKWTRTIPEVREAMLEVGGPYVIENVKDAAWDMLSPVTLCGCMFDLSTIDSDGVRIFLQRPRLFETNWGLVAPRVCNHSQHVWVAGAYGGARRDKYEAKYVRKGGYVPPDKDVVKALLGITHNMTWGGLYECLPPAYAEYIGRQFATWLERSKR